MSSTGRGPRRGGPDDVFPTPGWCVRRLLEAWRPRGWILEPGAGDGAIIRAATEVLGPRRWVAVESRATCEPALRALEGVDVAIADFLRWEPDPLAAHDVGASIGNAPFALNEEFFRRARHLFPTAELCFLCRLGFLASEKRVPLWRDLGAPDVFLLPNRPSFTPDGATDSSDYAWIVLPPEPRRVGRFTVLDLTPAEERGKGRRRRRA